MLRIASVALVLGIAGTILHLGPAGAGIGDLVSDFLHLQEELRVKAPARPLAEVVAGIGERYLLLVDVDGGVRAWDFETGGQVAIEGRRPAGTRAVFPNERGANLIVADVNGRVHDTVGLSFTPKTTLLPAGAARDAVAVSPRAPVVAAAGGGRLQLHNLATGQTAGVPVTEPVTGLWVSDDGRFVAYEAGGVLRVLDADRLASLPLEPAGPARRVRFYYDAAGALGLARQDAPTRLTLYRHAEAGFVRTGGHAFDAEPHDFWIRSDGQVAWLRQATLGVATPGAGRARTVFTAKEPLVYGRHLKGGDDVLLVHRSGVLAVVEARTGKIVVTGIGTGSGWAVIDASKRYDGSAAGGREIAWVVQKVDLELEKFTRHFYEPGLLLHYIGHSDLGFASAGHQGPFPVPPAITEVKVLDNVAGSGRTVVLATARSITDEIAGIDVYHNGKRVSDTTRITDETLRRGDLRFRSVGVEIHPVPGPNTLAVTGVGRLAIEGPTHELSFDRPGTPSPALHALVVGIDRYAARALRLGYARQDAEAVARLMRSSKGFDRVAVAELYDGQARPEAVLAGLRAAAAAAAPGDTILVYLAGHGVAIRGGWYFLSPAVASLDESEVLRRSVSAEQMTAVLKESKASRVVLMIDSCNSGAVVRDIKGLLQNRLYTQIGRALGFAVLAASRQDQVALERATLGHGVFTAAVVSGLSGAADRNADARVTARELAAYLSRRIPVLATEHLQEVQIPVAYVPSEDFVLRALR